MSSALSGVFAITLWIMAADAMSGHVDTHFDGYNPRVIGSITMLGAMIMTAPLAHDLSAAVSRMTFFWTEVAIAASVFAFRAAYKHRSLIHRKVA